MKIKSGTKFAGVFGAAVLAAAIASPAQASGPSLKDLASRSLAGKLTSADWVYLKAHPAIMGIIPSNKVTEGGASTVSTKSTGMFAATTTYCAATDRYQIHSSLLGSTIFRYHTYAHWCWTGTIVRVDTHYPYLDQIQNVVVNKGIMTNELRNANPSWTIHTQNYIQLCTLGKSLGSICYANLYPTNWVTVSNKSGSTFKHSI